MATPTADTYPVAAGTIVWAGGYAPVAPGAPLTLTFELATPERISIRALLGRTVAAGTRVQAEVKTVGSSLWRAAGEMFLVLAANLPTGAAFAGSDNFAGVLFDCTPGTAYDVRLTGTEPGNGTWSITGTHTTRALPPAAPTPNKFATPATIAAQLLTLVAGDCLQLADGTYPAITLARSGTSNSPIYIIGASRTGVVISSATACVTWGNASHLVLERMTLQGSGVDSDKVASSAGINYSTGQSQTNTTIRNVSILGTDRGCKAYTQVYGRLVYNCTFVGNNTWDKTYTIQPGDIYASLTWNDDGVSGPGIGNCVWNCTFSGHGDCIKQGGSSTVEGVTYSGGNHSYRNRVIRTGDDAIEFDTGAGNCSYTDNEVMNCGQAASLDVIFGGPIYFARNRIANTTRGPIKPTSFSQHVKVLCNTFVRTAGVNPSNFYAASSAANDGASFRNNLIVYRSASGSVIGLDCSFPGLDWDYNALYPSTANIRLGAGRGTYAGLAAAKAALAPLMAHDIAEVSNPFAATITLAADHTTEYAGSMDFTLATGAASRNAGVAIPGLTDGFSGAAPDIGAVIAGQAVVAVGDQAINALPTWTTSATSGTWGVLPSANTLLSIDPEADPNLNPNHPGQAPWHGTSGISEVFNAWSGGCWDDAGNFYSDIAGGHNGLALNARFKFAAGRDAPVWSLRGTFSGAKGTPAVNYSDAVTLPTSKLPDGEPRGTHTWNASVFAPGTGSILAGLSGRYYDGDFGPRWAVKFDAVTGAATYSAVPAAGSGSSSTIAACFDPTRGTKGSVWRRWGGTSLLQRLDIAADTWTNVGAAQAWAGECSLTYLEGHDCILIGNGSAQTGQAVTGGWCVVDCVTGQYYFPTFIGAPALGVAGPGGFWPGNTQPRWSQARGKVYAWGNASQTTSVTTLTPGANPRTDPWTVGSIAVSPSNAVTPTAARPNGTYGRFGLWEQAGVLLLLNEHTTSGYYFKL